MNTQLDLLRSDLKFQLETPGEIDWDYFLDMAIAARNQANKEKRNYVG